MEFLVYLYFMNGQKKLMKSITDIEELGFRTIHGQQTQRRVKEQSQRVSWLKGHVEVVWSGFNQDVSMINESTTLGNIERKIEILTRYNDETWLLFCIMQVELDHIAETLLIRRKLQRYHSIMIIDKFDYCLILHKVTCILHKIDNSFTYLLETIKQRHLKVTT